MDEISSDDDAFSGAVSLLFRHWRLLVATTATGIAVAVTGYLLVPRSYSAQVVVLPTEGESAASMIQGAASRLGALTGIAGFGLESGGFRSEGLALLSSTEFIHGFVRDNDLLPVLFFDKFDSTEGNWKVSEEHKPTLNDAARLFSHSIMSVDEDVDLGTISIRTQWRDPNLAADWANAIVRRLNARIRERVIREAEQSRQYLEEELKKAGLVELRSTIYGLIETHINTAAMARARPDYAFRVVANAVPSDSDDFDSPRLGLYVMAGMMLGAMMGLLAGAFSEWHPYVIQQLGNRKPLK